MRSRRYRPRSVSRLNHFGEVAERSNATDCKSVGLAPSEVRILPSPPAFARRGGNGALGGGIRLAGQFSPNLDCGASGVDRVGSLTDGAVAVQAGLPAEAKGFRVREGGSNSVVESQPSKLLVAGSIPVSRSRLRSAASGTASSYGRQASPG